MARAKKPVIVVVPANEKVADMLYQLALTSGHVSEGMFGPAPETSVGSNILKARTSLKDGFTTSFVSFIRPLAKVIDNETPEVQDLYVSILKVIAEEKPELVSAAPVKTVKSAGEKNLNSLVHFLKN